MSQQPLAVKALDNFPDVFVPTNQGGENLFASNARWLSEGYLKSKLHVIVHIRDGKGTQLAAIYQRSYGGGIEGYSNISGSTSEGGLQEISQFSPLRLLKGMGNYIPYNGDEKAMLVSIIDLVEPEEFRSLSNSGEVISGVDSVVGLDVVDSLYCSIGHALYFSHLVGSVFAGRLVNREVNSSILGFGHDGAAFYQVPGKM